MHTTLIFQTFFHFKISHRSRDFRVGHTKSNYRFSSSSSSDEERPPEGAHFKHSATEGVHFHYQSRRGAAHSGHPSSCTLPITTDAPITLLYTPLTSTHFSNTNLHGRTLFGHPSSLHTFKLPVTTDAPITLSTPLTSTYFSATNHDGAHSLDPLSSTNLHGRTLFFFFTHPRTLYITNTRSYGRSTAFHYLSSFV